MIFSGLSARLPGADRGDGVAGAKRQRTSGGHGEQRERTPKAAGGTEHEPGQDNGTWESWHTHRREGCTFLNLARRSAIPKRVVFSFFFIYEKKHATCTPPIDENAGGRSPCVARSIGWPPGLDSLEHVFLQLESTHVSVEEDPPRRCDASSANWSVKPSFQRETRRRGGHEESTSKYLRFFKNTFLQIVNK